MKKIHFIGIGGIGMSGLAAISLAEGKAVTGSDLEENSLTRRLRLKGGAIYRGHSADNIARDVSLVVRSACIKDDNPEVIRARELGMPVISRGEFLRMVMDEFPLSAAITGTHGKTTTTALIAHIMEYCGKDPTLLVGGEMERFGSNAKSGNGGVIITEVDESDGSFRDVGSTCALVTNIEREHMDYYDSLENLMGAYGEFIRRVSPEGTFFYNGEDPEVCRLSKLAQAKKVDFGIDGDFKATCKNLQCASSIEFDFVLSGKNLGKVRSSLIGRHNVMNLLGAIALGMELGGEFGRIAEAVASFGGVKRRFEVKGRIGTIEVIEDYAHHPTEISAVIRAAKDYAKGRLIVIFQPHRHSRTHDLAGDFINCFYDSDVLILTHVYSAFEDPFRGVGVRDIYEKIDRSRFEILDFVSKDRIPEYVSGIAREGDMVLILGAGDIREVSGPVVRMIGKKRKHLNDVRRKSA